MYLSHWTMQRHIWYPWYCVILMGFTWRGTTGANKESTSPRIRINVADDGSCSYVVKIPPCENCNCESTKNEIANLQSRVEKLEKAINRLLETNDYVESSYGEFQEYSQSFKEVSSPVKPTHNIGNTNHDRKHPQSIRGSQTTESRTLTTEALTDPQVNPTINVESNLTTISAPDPHTSQYYGHEGDKSLETQAIVDLQVTPNSNHETSDVAPTRHLEVVSSGTSHHEHVSTEGHHESVSNGRHHESVSNGRHHESVSIESQHESYSNGRHHQSVSNGGHHYTNSFTTSTKHFTTIPSPTATQYPTKLSKLLGIPFHDNDQADLLSIETSAADDKKQRENSAEFISTTLLSPSELKTGTHRKEENIGEFHNVTSYAINGNYNNNTRPTNIVESTIQTPDAGNGIDEKTKQAHESEQPNSTTEIDRHKPNELSDPTDESYKSTTKDKDSSYAPNGDHGGKLHETNSKTPESPHYVKGTEDSSYAPNGDHGNRLQETTPESPNHVKGSEDGFYAPNGDHGNLHQETTPESSHHVKGSEDGFYAPNGDHGNRLQETTPESPHHVKGSEDGFYAPNGDYGGIHQETTPESQHHGKGSEDSSHAPNGNHGDRLQETPSKTPESPYHNEGSEDGLYAPNGDNGGGLQEPTRQTPRFQITTDDQSNVDQHGKEVQNNLYAPNGDHGGKLQEPTRQTIKSQGTTHNPQETIESIKDTTSRPYAPNGDHGEKLQTTNRQTPKPQETTDSSTENPHATDRIHTPNGDNGGMLLETARRTILPHETTDSDSLRENPHVTASPYAPSGDHGSNLQVATQQTALPQETIDSSIDNPLITDKLYSPNGDHGSRLQETTHRSLESQVTTDSFPDQGLTDTLHVPIVSTQASVSEKITITSDDLSEIVTQNEYENADIKLPIDHRYGSTDIVKATQQSNPTLSTIKQLEEHEHQKSHSASIDASNGDDQKSGTQYLIHAPTTLDPTTEEISTDEVHLKDYGNLNQSNSIDDTVSDNDSYEPNSDHELTQLDNNDVTSSTYTDKETDLPKDTKPTSVIHTHQSQMVDNLIDNPKSFNGVNSDNIAITNQPETKTTTPTTTLPVKMPHTTTQAHIEVPSLESDDDLPNKVHFNNTQEVESSVGNNPPRGQFTTEVIQYQHAITDPTKTDEVKDSFLHGTNMANVEADFEINEEGITIADDTEGHQIDSSVEGSKPTGHSDQNNETQTGATKNEQNYKNNIANMTKAEDIFHHPNSKKQNNLVNVTENFNSPPFSSDNVENVTTSVELTLPKSSQMASNPTDTSKEESDERLQNTGYLDIKDSANNLLNSKPTVVANIHKGTMKIHQSEQGDVDPSNEGTNNINDRTDAADSSEHHVGDDNEVSATNTSRESTEKDETIEMLSTKEPTLNQDDNVETHTTGAKASSENQLIDDNEVLTTSSSREFTEKDETYEILTTREPALKQDDNVETRGMDMTDGIDATDSYQQITKSTSQSVIEVHNVMVTPSEGEIPNKEANSTQQLDPLEMDKTSKVNITSMTNGDDDNNLVLETEKGSDDNPTTQGPLQLADGNVSNNNLEEDISEDNLVNVGSNEVNNPNFKDEFLDKHSIDGEIESMEGSHLPNVISEDEEHVDQLATEQSMVSGTSASSSSFRDDHSQIVMEGQQIPEAPISNSDPIIAAPSTRPEIYLGPEQTLQRTTTIKQNLVQNTTPTPTGSSNKRDENTNGQRDPVPSIRPFNNKAGGLVSEVSDHGDSSTDEDPIDISLPNNDEQNAPQMISEVDLVGGEEHTISWNEQLESDYDESVSTDSLTPTPKTQTESAQTLRPLLDGEEHGILSQNKIRWKDYKSNVIISKPERPIPKAKAVNCVDGCACLHEKGFKKTDVYLIPNPPKSGRRGRMFSVTCQMGKDGSAWTVIQRRVDGSTNFHRPWDRYAHGFGVPDGNFWIGNNFLFALTRRFPYELRVEFTDWKDKFGYALYDRFEVLNAKQKYRLLLGNYIKGNRGDALSYHNNTEFSTTDQDNDLSNDINCAEIRQSGFWFKACNQANPNGRWIGTHRATGLNGGVITWGTWPRHGFTYALKTFKMMIRPVPGYVP